MRTIFHLGYPKCGSTSLQKNVFLGINEINFTEEKGKFLESIRSDCEMGIGELKELWGDISSECVVPDRVNVFSHEGVLFRGIGPEDALQRLAAIKPDAHVLLILRPQSEIIRSLYDMYPSINLEDRESGKEVPIGDFVDSIFEKGKPFDAYRFLFAPRVKLAVELFGRARVHVFSFDSIFRTGDDVGRLSEVLLIGEGSLRKALAMPAVNEFAEHASRRKLRRIMGPVRGSWFLPQPVLWAINHQISRFTKASRTELPQDIANRIKASYNDDNARLAELVPEVGWLS